MDKKKELDTLLVFLKKTQEGCYTEIDEKTLTKKRIEATTITIDENQYYYGIS